MGFNCLKASATLMWQFLSLTSKKFLVLILSTPEGWWLSGPWSWPVVLNMGPLDLESSTLNVLFDCPIPDIAKVLPKCIWDQQNKTSKTDYCWKIDWISLNLHWKTAKVGSNAVFNIDLADLSKTTLDGFLLGYLLWCRCFAILVSFAPHLFLLVG